MPCNVIVTDIADGAGEVDFGAMMSAEHAKVNRTLNPLLHASHAVQPIFAATDVITARVATCARTYDRGSGAPRCG